MTLLRWWALIGMLAMVGLGLAVGDGSTSIDDWFSRTGVAHPGLGRLLLWFTYPPVLLLLLALAAVVALYRRRWRMAAAVVLSPLLAIIVTRLLKQLFRRHKGDGLAYPSGHVTTAVVVLGMVLLVVGAKAWSLVAAAVMAILGLLGQAFTHHYFTDTIGAVFLGTALVCVAFLAVGLDRCQPDCDLDHSGG